MEKIVVKVDGMQCGMCEAHVNEAVRAAFPVKKVTSSHAKGETVILTEQDIDDAKLKEVIDKTGYEMGAVTREPYEKKGLSAFMSSKKGCLDRAPVWGYSRLMNRCEGVKPELYLRNPEQGVFYELLFVMVFLF